MTRTQPPLFCGRKWNRASPSPQRHKIQRRDHRGDGIEYTIGLLAIWIVWTCWLCQRHVSLSSQRNWRKLTRLAKEKMQNHEAGHWKDTVFLEMLSRHEYDHHPYWQLTKSLITQSNCLSTGHKRIVGISLMTEGYKCRSARYFFNNDEKGNKETLWEKSGVGFRVSKTSKKKKVMVSNSECTEHFRKKWSVIMEVTKKHITCKIFSHIFAWIRNP